MLRVSVDDLHLPHIIHRPPYPPFRQFSSFPCGPLCCSRAFAELLIIIGIPDINVGMYALLGCGAFMGGLMRMVCAMVRGDPGGGTQT